MARAVEPDRPAPAVVADVRPGRGLRTWIYNDTEGNLLAMVRFHGTGNAQSDVVWGCGSSADIYWVYGIAQPPIERHPRP